MISMPNVASYYKVQYVFFAVRKLQNHRANYSKNCHKIYIAGNLIGLQFAKLIKMNEKRLPHLPCMRKEVKVTVKKLAVPLNRYSIACVALG